MSQVLQISHDGLTLPPCRPLIFHELAWYDGALVSFSLVVNALRHEQARARNTHAQHQLCEKTRKLDCHRAKVVIDLECLELFSNAERGKSSPNGRKCYTSFRRGEGPAFSLWIRILCHWCGIKYGSNAASVDCYGEEV